MLRNSLSLGSSSRGSLPLSLGLGLLRLGVLRLGVLRLGLHGLLRATPGVCDIPLDPIDILWGRPLFKETFFLDGYLFRQIH